jgi:hypothetical protein
MSDRVGPRGGYRHREAFAVMTYRSDDGSEEEEVWNSRDGVTPFAITLRSGREATHVNWRSDVPRPDYAPPPGSRMFVDITAARARQIAGDNCARWWNDEGAEGMLARSSFASLDDMIAVVADGYLSRAGGPDLIEVPTEGWTT